jgi:hypothetical protein
MSGDKVHELGSMSHRNKGNNLYIYILLLKQQGQMKWPDLGFSALPGPDSKRELEHFTWITYRL